MLEPLFVRRAPSLRRKGQPELRPPPVLAGTAQPLQHVPPHAFVGAAPRASTGGILDGSALRRTGDRSPSTRTEGTYARSNPSRSIGLKFYRVRPWYSTGYRLYSSVPRIDSLVSSLECPRSVLSRVDTVDSCRPRYRYNNDSKSRTLRSVVRAFSVFSWDHLLRWGRRLDGG